MDGDELYIPPSRQIKHEPKEAHAMDGIASDKVNIHVGGGDGGGGAAGMAALVAALGNRNEGSDNAALIAALGNRNDDSSAWAPLIAMMGHRNDGDGYGMNALWPILLLALLGRGRGGGFLGGDGDGDGCLGVTALSKLGTIEGAVPLAASQVGNEICRSTGEITNILNQNNLSQLQATSNLKDTVQNASALILQSGSQNTKEILGAICGLGSKIDANQIMDLQRQLGVAQAEAAEERGSRRIKEVEVTVSQNVNQQQAQQQQQQQFGELFRCIDALRGQVQRVSQGQDVINFGTMAGSGNQSQNTSQVGR